MGQWKGAGLEDDAEATGDPWDMQGGGAAAETELRPWGQQRGAVVRRREKAGVLPGRLILRKRDKEGAGAGASGGRSGASRQFPAVRELTFQGRGV